MNTREMYQAACRNYRMQMANRAHSASDQYNLRYHDKKEFVPVTPEMRELGEKSVIHGMNFSANKFYQGRVYNNRLYWRLKQSRKGA